MNNQMQLEDWGCYYTEHILSRDDTSISSVLRAHIYPTLGQIRLADLTPDMVRELLIEKELRGNKQTGGGLSVQTVRNIYFALNACIKAAVEQGLLPWNPVSAVAPPERKNTSTQQTITQTDRNRVTVALANSTELPDVGLYLVVQLRLRRGEVCGLRWGDVSAAEKKLCVVRTVRRQPDRSGASKTTLAVTAVRPRTIPLDPIMCRVLDNHRERYGTTFGHLPGPEDPVCYTGTGKAVDPDVMTARWASVLRELGIPHVTLDYICR